VGDHVYYIPDYRGYNLFCVRCAVLGIDEHGCLWLDEPVGYAVYPDEVFADAKDAENELAARYNRHPPGPWTTLGQWRVRRIEFLRETGATGPFDYPDKEGEWFGYSS
jgi:hypothetical protein